MAQIIEALQSKYVPTVTSNGGESKILQKVIFDGDQLTEERARNCQWANTLAESPSERLEGLTPAFADWHLKMFLGVCLYSKINVNNKVYENKTKQFLRYQGIRYILNT